MYIQCESKITHHYSRPYLHQILTDSINYFTESRCIYYAVICIWHSFVTW